MAGDLFSGLLEDRIDQGRIVRSRSQEGVSRNAMEGRTIPSVFAEGTTNPIARRRLTPTA